MKIYLLLILLLCLFRQYWCEYIELKDKVPYNFSLSHPGTIKFKFTPKSTYYNLINVKEMQRTPSNDNPDQPCAYFIIAAGKEPTETDYYVKRNASSNYIILDPASCDWYVVVKTTGITKETTKCDLYAQHQNRWHHGMPIIRCDENPDPDSSPNKASKESLSVTFIFALFFFAFTIF